MYPIPHPSCKVPYDRCIACCVRVGCWNQQCKTIIYIVSTVICISERGLLHVCHVNVSSNKILGKAVFLLQPPLKVLLPKYPYINGHYDRPHYRVSIDGRLIEVSFILTRYMNTAVGHDGNTIARFTLAIQHTRCSTRTGTRLVRDRNPVFQNLFNYIYSSTSLPTTSTSTTTLLPVVRECKRHAGRN